MSHSFLSHVAELWCLRGATTNNKECTMDARLNLFGNPTAGKILKYITSAGKVITDSTLPAATQQLVALRASQINGCGFCTDTHTKDAALAGRRRRASTWSRPGGRPRCSPMPSALPWS